MVMWSKAYSKTVSGLKLADLWAIWADVNNWHEWQGDIEYAELTGEFVAGNKFILKPKASPKVVIRLIEVLPYTKFVDLTRFPLAKMYGIHEFIQNGDEIEIKTTIKVTGLFSYVWRKLVAEKVANGEEEQTNNLITRAKKLAEAES
jgi:hypothetical protein